MPQITIGSLFSGIGGLELGLEWAGLGPTVWQVETDPFCREVLAQHWPDADRSVTDVRRATAATLAPVDLICGGFPCQDVSSAGKGAGLAGSRSGLWFEFERVILGMEPRFVVVENVASGAIRWVDDVMAGLELAGYAAVPFPLSAADVGAWHLRRRVFVVAHPFSHHLRQQPGRRDGSRGAAGSPETGLAGEAGDAADVDRDGEHALAIDAEVGRARAAPQARRGAPQRSAQPGLVRAVHGVSAGLDVAAIGHERGKHDVARRQALGNSVVPQCAEVIGWIVRELMGAS